MSSLLMRHVTNAIFCCQGVTKRMKISRRVVGNDGSVRKEEKVLTINVKPGKANFVITVASDQLFNPKTSVWFLPIRLH